MYGVHSGGRTGEVPDQGGVHSVPPPNLYYPEVSNEKGKNMQNNNYYQCFQAVEMMTSGWECPQCHGTKFAVKIEAVIVDNEMIEEICLDSTWDYHRCTGCGRRGHMTEFQWNG